MIGSNLSPNIPSHIAPDVLEHSQEPPSAVILNRLLDPLFGVGGEIELLDGQTLDDCYWEQRGIDPGQGHLHGTDIRDRETPYFANFNWSHFRAIPHCLAECGGAEWLEVVHPTRNGALDCLCIIPLDRKKVKELRW